MDIDRATADAVFAAALDRRFRRTNIGYRAEISHGHYTYLVVIAATARAVIDGRYGYGGDENFLVNATPAQDAALRGVIAQQNSAR